MHKIIFSIILLLVAFIMSGCAARPVYKYIQSNKMMEMPSDINYEFIPTKAMGQETITQGTDKIIDKDNFTISHSTLSGLKFISISKGGVKVTVAHASFNYLKDRYGLYDEIKHSLSGGGYPILHLWSGTPVHYSVDNNQVYQTYTKVPFHECVTEVYRNDDNKILLDEFNKLFAEGSIQPYPSTLTTQETKFLMERTIGQEFCSSYYKYNIAFYLKVENLGTEKIRLWPIQESVIVDSTNTQYNSLDKREVDNILLSWRKKLKNMPDSIVNPHTGLHLIKKPADKQRYQGYTVYEEGMMVSAVDPKMPGEIAGIRVGDIITEIDRVPGQVPASAMKRLLGGSDDKKDINTMKRLESGEDIKKLLSTKIPGDKINLTLLRNGQVIKKSLKLMSEFDIPRPRGVKLLAGGNVYPGVIYDGHLVFDTLLMLKNYEKGSTLKLIIPLIGTSFDAADRPIRSFEYEFEFTLDKI
jgi:hypothetical protein